MKSNKNNSICTKFSILHLNVNSIFSKLHEVSQLLDKNFDLISFNETKLDESIPISFYCNSNYNMLRLDRNRHGGGLLVFIKKDYDFIQGVHCKGIESVHFQLKISNDFYNFVCCYKPPSQNNLQFLDFLSEIKSTMNKNIPLFIIGDLNMDLNTSKGMDLVNFMDIHNLKNFVTEFTRSVITWNSKKNAYRSSNSIIDVVLHNSDLIENIETTDCAFSDHKILKMILRLKILKLIKIKKILR